MEKSWIDIQEDTPKAEGEYDVLIQSLGDRSLQRESTAHLEIIPIQNGRGWNWKRMNMSPYGSTGSPNWVTDMDLDVLSSTFAIQKEKGLHRRNCIWRSR